MIKGPEIRIMRGYNGGRFNLSVWIDDFSRHTEKCFTAKPIEFEEKEIFTETPPSLMIPTESGQQLMDDLWQAGLRPSEGTGSAGALAAVEKHLSDMRTIAFNRLKIGEK